MEEYDWGEFAVITSLLPGYDTFVGIVQSYTDTSYFLWNLQDIVSMEMSVGASEVKTKRILEQVGRDMRRVDWAASDVCKSIITSVCEVHLKFQFQTCDLL